MNNEYSVWDNGIFSYAGSPWQFRRRLGFDSDLTQHHLTWPPLIADNGAISAPATAVGHVGQSAMDHDPNAEVVSEGM